MKITNKIKGGLSDNIPDSEFNLVSLLKGRKVEMEHTSDKDIAKEIAKDHLSEDPLYYDKIETLNLESLLREDSDLIGKEISDEYEIKNIINSDNGDVHIELFNQYSGKTSDYIDYNKEENKFYITTSGIKLSIPDEYYSISVKGHNLLNKIISLNSKKEEVSYDGVDVSKYKSHIINVETNYTRYYRKFPKDIHLQNKIKLQFNKLKKIATKGEWEVVRDTIYTEKHDFLIQFKKTNNSLTYIPYFENKIGEGLNGFETVYRVLYNGKWYQFEDGDVCLEMVEFILSGKNKKEKETKKPAKKGADIIQSLLRVIRFHLKEDRDIKSLYNIAIRATQEGDEDSIKGLIQTLSNKLSQKPDVQIEIPKKGKNQYVEKILQYLLNKHK